MSKTKKLSIKIKLIIIFGSIIAFLGIAVLGFIGFLRLPVASYYKASEKAFVIPGLDDDFVPQGFCYDSEREYFIVSGYSSDDGPSSLYLLDKTGKVLKEKQLLSQDGKKFTGHAGGVAMHRYYIYLAGSNNNCIYVYNYADLLFANEESIRCEGSLSLQKSDTDYVRASFITATDSALIVGEFYRAESHDTQSSHKVTTSCGDYNQAIAIEYAFTNINQNFNVSYSPSKAYSLPDQVQGLEINNGKLYLSTSYGLAFSHILEYNLDTAKKDSKISILGVTIPLYELDSSCLVKDYKLPPMSEEIVFVNNYLYTMSESACNKYFFGKLTGGKWCYKTDLAKMK